MSRVFYFFLAAVICVWAAVVTYQVADRSWPTESRDRVVLTPVVKRGEELRISSNVTQRKRCRTHTDRFIISSDGQRHALPSTDRESGMGEIGKEEPVLTVIRVAPDSFVPPSDVALGPAVYRTIPTAWCNWTNIFAPIHGDIRDTIFTIVE